MWAVSLVYVSTNYITEIHVHVDVIIQCIV